MGAAWNGYPRYIVTEYCSGGSLYDILHVKKVHLSWDQKLKICYDVSKGAAFLHTYTPPIIHRDLKSRNVWLQDPLTEGLPNSKIGDFGISLVNDTGERRESQHVTGTLLWMAPEVLAKKSFNEKVDVYAFGVVMFEIVTGCLPYVNPDDGSFPDNLECSVIKNRRPDVSLVPPDCPHALRELIVDCWHHDPHMRPSFETITEILKQLFQNRPT